jgi:hypothetical protein
MTIQKIAREVLRYLFSEYQKGPAVIYNITPITKKYNADPVAVTDYLIEQSWIRERWVYPDNAVACKITIKGIEEIDHVYVRAKLRQLIGGLGEAGGKKELMEVLAFNIQEYSIAMDIVRQLETMGLIKILHPKDTIIIELTEEGKSYYEKGNRTFFTLMSY